MLFAGKTKARIVAATRQNQYHHVADRGGGKQPDAEHPQMRLAKVSGGSILKGHIDQRLPNPLILRKRCKPQRLAGRGLRVDTAIHARKVRQPGEGARLQMIRHRRFIVLQ